MIERFSASKCEQCNTSYFRSRLIYATCCRNCVTLRPMMIAISSHFITFRSGQLLRVFELLLLPENHMSNCYYPQETDFRLLLPPGNCPSEAERWCDERDEREPSQRDSSNIVMGINITPVVLGQAFDWISLNFCYVLVTFRLRQRRPHDRQSGK